MIRIYGLKSCDACRKARAALEGAVLVDLRDAPMAAEQRRAALAKFGAALVNTRSATWRGLSGQERARSPEALLADHPALMKRPLIDAGGTLYLGWGEETRAALGV